MPGRSRQTDQNGKAPQISNAPGAKIATSITPAPGQPPSGDGSTAPR